VRPGLDIRVVEDTDKVVYLKLPTNAELTDIDLDRIVGGGLVDVAGWITSIYAPEVPAIRQALPAVKITVTPK
jgi:hypothetical protein